MEVGLGPGHILLDRDPAPPHLKLKGNNPQLSVHVCCGQTAGWIKMPLSTEADLSPGDIVLVGDPRSPPMGAQHPQFWPTCCGQTAAWIKVPLGTGVGLRPGDIGLQEDPAPPKGTQPPIFGPCLLWPNGWMDEDTIWYGGRPRPRRHCVR